MLNEVQKRRLYLLIIATVAFTVRLIPSRTYSLAGNDAYVHHDLVMRIVSDGPGIIARDIPSLMGLKAYGYPPLYHMLGAALYMLFRTELVFFLLGPVLGTLAVLVMYRVATEIFSNEDTALLSAFLFSMVPSFVTRTSIFIPESLGLLLTTGILYMTIRYIKTVPGYPDIDKFELGGFLNIFRGESRYIVWGLMLFGIYIFTHRGWIFFAIAIMILLATFLIPSFRKRPLEFGLLFILGGLGILEFIMFAARFQSVPVTILGFPKWMGAVQLVLGLYGAYLLVRSRNPIHKFLIIWAAVFMIIGTYSFRFRDPYAAIPLSLLAGYAFTEVKLKLDNSERLKYYPLFRWNIGPLIMNVVLVFLILTPVIQGAAIGYASVVTPTVQQNAAFEWINQNTPSDAVFLSTLEDSYLLIGNTHRRDVLLGNTVYKGFMGDAPSLGENNAVKNDVSTIFESPLPSEACYLIEKNNVSYVYMSKTVHRKGLGLYIPFNPHFKTCFVSGDVSVYKYIKNPEIQSNSSEIVLDGEHSEIVNFIEKFWNGYSYSEAGGMSYSDPAEDLEFGSLFKGSYDSNAMIATLYIELGNIKGEEKLSSRGEYLLKWLSYKQMDNGSFPGGMPPSEYTLSTIQTIYPLMNLKSAEGQKIVNKGLKFVDSQVNGDEINISPGTKSSVLIGTDYLKLKTESQVAGMYPAGKREVIYSLINKQGYDGSWSSRAYENIGILKGLALYYISTNDSKTAASMKKGAEWLKDHQNPDGSFQGDGGENTYCLSHYSDAALIYSLTGDTDSMKKTIEYMMKRGVKNDPTPLHSFLTFIWDLKLVYGSDRALDMATELLNAEKKS
ncbi:prenyltransferase/squalene oxidase repeat-containing protein [Methanothermobacter sp. K4]|uniref:prenyltransferase/squalene oxidase repeat-containing protein n=1 Tax=Methanothermobacter sp. K4 TaxID=2913262 RepID=UPI001EDAB8F4|nr:prenyltransferase/squalene oxidase repeat-containing protein [Methanothermobacter sp. K4]MCG2827623.1 glycosyltransferase family 39 protein [Methanothermobacter sp. K4]